MTLDKEAQPESETPAVAASPATPEEDDNLAHLLHERPSWISQFVGNIRDLIHPPKIEMPEGITSKPLDASDEFSSHLLREAPPWHKQFIQNVTEFFNPPKVEPLEGITSKPAEGGDELSSHLLHEAPPWHKQFLQNIKELVKPEKLAPLEGITSKPIEVKKETGLYAGNEWKAGLLSATINIGVILLLLFVGTSDVVQQTVKDTVTPLFMPRTAPPPSAPAKQTAGGGGGGNRSPIEASKGKLPKQAPKQFTPPRVDPLENPKLPMTPTIAPTGPVPDIRADNFGDPLAGIGIPSNGTGLGGSIGEGIGPGVGPGSGGGFGGGAYRIGGGVSAPTVIYQVEPEYSEEARKAKYAGKVMLSIVVDEEGLPQNIRVVRKLGLGLDEKAIEAVQKWRFNPGMKDGKPVPVQATIEVTFRLL